MRHNRARLKPIDVPCPRGCGRDAYEVNPAFGGGKIIHFASCRYEPPRPPSRRRRALVWFARLLEDVFG